MQHTVVEILTFELGSFGFEEFPESLIGIDARCNFTVQGTAVSVFLRENGYMWKGKWVSLGGNDERPAHLAKLWPQLQPPAKVS